MYLKEPVKAEASLRDKVSLFAKFLNVAILFISFSATLVLVPPISTPLTCLGFTDRNAL